MRILVTDAAGTVGRLVTRELLAAGHAVSGIATRPHRQLDPQLNFVCGSLQAPILQELANEADVVIHLAPVDSRVPGSAGIPGVVRVSDVTARAGARLLFVSAAAGEPALYRHAEMLVSTGWAPHLVIRAAPLLGRQLDWMVCRTVTTLLRARKSPRPIRVLHIDDLVRFLVTAVDNDRTGVVDLATCDATNTIAAWRLLGAARCTAIPPRWRRMRRWTELHAEMNPTALQEIWDFTFGWPASQALVDTARGLAGRKITATRVIDLPGHVPLWTQTHPGIEPAAWQHLWSATPMTLDVQLSGLRTAIRLMGQALDLAAEVSAEWEDRALALFSHHIYRGVAAAMVTASQVSVPIGVRMVTMLQHLKTDTSAFSAAAVLECQDAHGLAALSDAALEAQARLIRDRIRQGWCLTALLLIGIGVPAALRHHARIDAEASSLNAIIGDDRLTGEVELAHPIFGDDPASVSSAKTVPMSRFSRPMVTRGVHELAYTTTLRFTDQLRMILREIGSRRVAADQIEVVDDVFFMIFDELFTAPTDIRLRIKRRRTERELQLPDMIDHI